MLDIDTMTLDEVANVLLGLPAHVAAKFMKKEMERVSEYRTRYMFDDVE